MTSLTTSIKHFASLGRAPGPTWTDATKRKAPHKPLLLLAVLDLVNRELKGRESGVLRLRTIK